MSNKEPEKAEETDDKDSPAVERWLEEFQKLSVDDQREVKRRFFEEFFPELLEK